MKRNFVEKILLFIGDISIVILSIYLSFVLRFQRKITLKELNPKTLILSSFVFITFFYIFGAYDSVEGETEKSKRNLALIVSSCLCASLANALIFYAVPSIRYGRGLIGLQFALITIFAILYRQIIRLIFKAATHEKKVYIIAPTEEHEEIQRLLKRLPGYHIVRFFNFDELVGIEVDSLLKEEIETVIFSGGLKMPEDIQERIMQFKVTGIHVVEITAFIEDVFKKIPIAFLKKDWILLTDGFSFLHTKVTQKIKRLFDASFAFSGLVISIPLWAVFSVLIPLDSKGPIIYRQLRVGKNGRQFWLLKFRTMINEAENGEAKWATESDPRITRVGKVLRKLRLDEIPQLLNVLKGEMSLVGPRPERPDFVCRLEKEIPFYALRHSVAPGLTGWAQVNYPYGASLKDAVEKLQFDLYYVKNMNIFLDIMIIIKTIRVVLTAKGAR